MRAIEPRPAAEIHVGAPTVRALLKPPAARQALIEAARNAFNPIDEETLIRARGWALALGLAFMARSADDPSMAALGRATVEAALTDDLI